MIVRMRKAFVVARKADRNSLLATLRELGVRHLQPVDPAKAVAAEETLLQIDRLSRAGQVLAAVRPTGQRPDLPVAEEAVEVCVAMGVPVHRVYDVGVAGLHRILGKVDKLQEAVAVVVVAGMEGALPSVVGGLVSSPVFAVPTSVGYGASFQGLAALLAMLNSCAPGVTVSNIDNGFSAGIAAARVARAVASSQTQHDPR